MQRQFVILTAPRSGSNMLVSVLDSHPDITCFGELMRKTPPNMVNDGYRGALKTLEEIHPRFREDEVRLGAPREFIKEVFSKVATGHIVGFKLMLRQHPTLLEQLVDDPSWAKIVLRRDNALAAYSSEKIAKITGQGSVRVGAEVKSAKCPFDRKAFARFVQRRNRQYEHVQKRLKAANVNWLDVEYRELGAQDGLQRILEFLGADPRYAAAPKTVKRNPSDILERFEEPNEVAKYLEENGLIEWKIEGAAS